MSRPSTRHLSRRERQIMDILYELGHASAADVQERLPDPPGYSSVRALLRILEEKGHLSHRQEGARYVYMPTQPRSRAAQSALSQVVRTFFGGSIEKTVATLLSSEDAQLTPEELERLSALIEEARRKEGEHG
jgi:BlaI family transcriptional regulator, penicillinase repressor